MENKDSLLWKILFTILSLFPVINLFFFWPGSKAMNFTKDLNEALRILYMIVGTFFFIISIVVSIWWIWEGSSSSSTSSKSETK